MFNKLYLCMKNSRNILPGQKERLEGIAFRKDILQNDIANLSLELGLNIKQPIERMFQNVTREINQRQKTGN